MPVRRGRARCKRCPTSACTSGTARGAATSSGAAPHRALINSAVLELAVQRQVQLAVVVPLHQAAASLQLALGPPVVQQSVQLLAAAAVAA